MDPITLSFTADYSFADSVILAAKAAFSDGLHDGQGYEGKVLDLAFSLEGSWRTIGVRVSQQEGKIQACVFANSDKATIDEIRNGLERMLCLDVDARGFASIITRNAVVAKLIKQHPGVRPVLFPSSYEAAARAIIGHQLPVRQAAAIYIRIAKQYGVSVDIAGHKMYAFPAPIQLENLPLVEGLAVRKIEQLRVLGNFVANGTFNSGYLRAMDREEALIHLQQLPGIGPFSAELILIRGAGDPDFFPKYEKRLHHSMAAAYHLGDNPDLKTLEEVADEWSPYRSWVGLLLRNF